MTVLDTNVFIYACDKSEPERQQKALDLIGRITDGVLLALPLIGVVDRRRSTVERPWARQ